MTVVVCECGEIPYVKRYVGSAETYFYCPACLRTSGGEEGDAKRNAIAAAVRADPGERGEQEPRS